MRDMDWAPLMAPPRSFSFTLGLALFLALTMAAHPGQTAEPPFAEANRAGYAYLNQVRKQAGLAPLKRHPLLERAAQNHADFLVKNKRDPRLKRLGAHKEFPDLPGFTGKSGTDRGRRAGYKGGVGEVIVRVRHKNKAAIAKLGIDWFMKTIYHRFGILSLHSQDVGIGIVEWEKNQYRVVINLGGGKKNKGLPLAVLWPWDGAQDVNPLFGHGEVPDPAPDLKYPGQPLTVQFDRFRRGKPELVTLKLFTVEGKGRGEKLTEVRRVRVLTAENDVHSKLSKYVFGLLPLDPLKQRQWYTAEARFRLNGKEKRFRWKFQAGEMSNNRKFTPIWRNDAELLRGFLRSGVDPNTRREKSGSTLLMETMFLKAPNPELVKVLLEAGADPNLARKDGATALDITIWKNRAGLMAQLLKGGALPNARRKKDGSTYLMRIVYAKEPRPDLVRILLDGGADPNLRRKNGGTAIGDAIRKNRPSMLAMLLKGGADPNARRQNDGTTYLMRMMYAKEPRPDLVRMLLEGGADPTLRRNNGGTAIGDAIRKNRPAMLAMFLKREADPNARRKKDGSTYLMRAINGKTSRPDMVRMLLEGGADPNLRRNNGRTAIGDAIRKNRPAILAMLLKSGGHPNATREKDGSTYLMRTVYAKKSRPELVRVLLEGGADPNLWRKNGRTAIGDAIRKNRPAILAMLLKGGADPNARRKKDGTTYLMRMMYAKGPRPELVRMLLEGGADPNLRRNNGRTAIGDAIRKNRPAMLAVLLKGGADPNRKNNRGRTALDLALKRNLPEIVNLLRKAGAVTGN